MGSNPGYLLKYFLLYIITTNSIADLSSLITQKVIHKTSFQNYTIQPQYPGLSLNSNLKS
jgi:hypothetical protein